MHTKNHATTTHTSQQERKKRYNSRRSEEVNGEATKREDNMSPLQPRNLSTSKLHETDHIAQSQQLREGMRCQYTAATWTSNLS
jgi:hypothetical protein